MSIYLDIYIITNAIMNYIILFLTQYITKAKSSYKKMIILSIIGALYSILIFFEKTKYFTGFIGKFIFSYILVRIAFNDKNIKNKITNLIIFYAVSFVLGGCGLYIYNLFCNNSNLYSILFSTLIISYSLISAVSLIFKKSINLSKLSDKIKIIDDDKEKVLDCFYDTGNNLLDPISKRPVILVNENKIENITNKNIRIIPYHSIGGSGHILGYIPDKIIINNTEIKAIIGIIEGNISYNDKYDAIANPNILNENQGA